MTHPEMVRAIARASIDERIHDAQLRSRFRPPPRRRHGRQRRPSVG